MNSRTSSFSVPTSRAHRRPSVSSRLSFAISNAEQGDGGPSPTGAENQIEEEIDEIKRYEVILPARFV
jgi:chloride channel 3/4/5